MWAIRVSLLHVLELEAGVGCEDAGVEVCEQAGSGGVDVDFVEVDFGAQHVRRGGEPVEGEQAGLLAGGVGLHVELLGRVECS